MKRADPPRTNGGGGGCQGASASLDRHKVVDTRVCWKDALVTITLRTGVLAVAPLLASLLIRISKCLTVGYHGSVKLNDALTGARS